MYWLQGIYSWRVKCLKFAIDGNVFWDGISPLAIPQNYLQFSVTFLNVYFGSQKRFNHTYEYGVSFFVYCTLLCSCKQSYLEIIQGNVKDHPKHSVCNSSHLIVFNCLSCRCLLSHPVKLAVIRSSQLHIIYRWLTTGSCYWRSFTIW